MQFKQLFGFQEMELMFGLAIQGDTSGCSQGSVDIITKVPFQYKESMDELKSRPEKDSGRRRSNQTQQSPPL